MLIALWLAAIVVAFVALAYVNAAGWLWILGVGFALIAGFAMHVLPGVLVIVLGILCVLLAVPLNVPWLRRLLISDAILGAFRKVLPPMSQTERDAIEAGTVWWDGELFSGRPNWSKLLALPAPTLTEEEQHFLDHDCDELCALISDWDTTHLLSLIH